MPSLKKYLRFALMTAILSGLCVIGASATCVGMGTVNADALRLRSEASTEASILATALQGDTLVVLEEENEGWYKVDYKSVEGFMSAEFVDVVTQVDMDLGYGLVQSEGSTLRVRSGPSTDFDAVTELYDHTVVNLTGIDNGWFKISYKDVTGYVSSDYMVTCKDAAGTRGDSDVINSLGIQLVTFAQQFLGCPYVWGGNGPNAFDCSGFTKYVYAHFGIELNRTASDQLYNGVKVARGEWQPGDLIFFDNGRVSTPVSHVGIYVGDGQFIHASTNSYTVQFNSLYSAHYSNTYECARRIF